MKNQLNFGTFFKFLEKNKAYTFIDLFGLAASLTFVILIAVYAIQEVSTDRFHKKADRIYALGFVPDSFESVDFCCSRRILLPDCIHCRLPAKPDSG
ncbi:MAG: hypothetical protein LBT78_03880 [Tannerella sp.]|jgi:hypothetical protein|nr:hypothetical protein [Tannerella sp.]